MANKFTKESTYNEEGYRIAQFRQRNDTGPMPTDGTRRIISAICCLIKITESQIDEESSTAHFIFFPPSSWVGHKCESS
jgi:hypothetical protein